MASCGRRYPFLPPEIAVNGVALRDFVVAVALGEAKLGAVAELAQHGEHFPLDVRGRFFRRVTEKDLVFDLQAAKLRIEDVQFLVDSHGTGLSSPQLNGSGGK